MLGPALAVLWAMSGAWLVVILLESWRRPSAVPLRSGTGTLMIVLVIFGVGVAEVPDVIGKASALRDMQSSSTALPVVQMPGLEGTWHLLAVLQTDGVLVRLPATPFHAQTRVVRLSDLVLIGGLNTRDR
jgi:hypothetical protein